MNFQKLEPILEKVEALGGVAYAVGGIVRDEILGLPSKDLDILITGIPAEQLKEMLELYGEVDEVGKSFGILKLHLEGLDEPVDVALPRKEISNGVGHQDFEVIFDSNLSVEDDLARRDFTINAIAKNLHTGELIDPFDGVKHCKKLELRLVSPKSFEDDPLRILRGIQFAARFKLAIRCLGEMSKNSFRLKYISKERIAIELQKLLSKGQVYGCGLKWMETTGIWDNLFPELKVGNAYEAIARVPQDIDLRMAVLFSFAIPKRDRSRSEIAMEVMEELKLSNAGIDIKKVAILVEYSNFKNHNYRVDTEKKVRKFIARQLDGDPKLFLELAQLWYANPSVYNDSVLASEILVASRNVGNILLSQDPLTLKELVVNGKDILQFAEDYKAEIKGPQIGVLLNKMLDLVLEDPSLNQREYLLGFINSALA